MYSPRLFFFFFFNDTATTEIYTLSLHDALPISRLYRFRPVLLQKTAVIISGDKADLLALRLPGDRKSTRLNSSHVRISYAVFCLKKKTKTNTLTNQQSPTPYHYLVPAANHDITQ